MVGLDAPLNLPFFAPVAPCGKSVHKVCSPERTIFDWSLISTHGEFHFSMAGYGLYNWLSLKVDLSLTNEP